MRYLMKSPPAEEPISLEDAKLHLRVDTDDEDALIRELISAAREYCEDITSRALVTQTIIAYPKSFGEALPRPPLQSVAKVTYTDSTGAEHTMAPGVDYLVDTVNERLVLPAGKAWPTFAPNPVNPIIVEYTAGYDIPPRTVRQAMKLLISYWYDNRQPGELDERMQLAVGRILRSKRVRWF